MALFKKNLLEEIWQTKLNFKVLINIVHLCLNLNGTMKIFKSKFKTFQILIIKRKVLQKLELSKGVKSKIAIVVQILIQTNLQIFVYLRLINLQKCFKTQQFRVKCVNQKSFLKSYKIKLQRRFISLQQRNSKYSLIYQ